MPLHWSLLPAAAALALYLSQAPPVSGDKDGSELTLVLATGGAAHPTGYPLYTLAGHAFAAIAHALGASFPWAANAWSAVGGAVAVFFLHALSARLVPDALDARPALRFAAALGPTALFALNPIWTYEATLAEVYSWHLAWALAACWVFHGLAARLSEPEPEAAPLPLDRAALGWGLLCGLGAAHHATSIFVSAPLTVVLAVLCVRDSRVQRRHAGLAVAAALLPLTTLAFVAYRAAHPAAWGWPTLEPGWDGFFAHVTGAAYHGRLGHFAPSADQRELLASYVYPFLFPTLLLLVAGAVVTRDARVAWPLRALAAAAVLGVAHAFNYGVPDPSSYFLPAMAIASACILPAAASIATAANLDALRAPRAQTGLAAVIALAALALTPGWIGTGDARRRVFVDLDREVHGMWADIPFDRAIVLFANDMAPRLVEYQLLRNEKPDIDVVNPLLLSHPTYRRRFTARHGFDPLEGVDPALLSAADPSPQALSESVGAWLNQKSPLPIILFDPATGQVRLLRKPGS